MDWRPIDDEARSGAPILAHNRHVNVTCVVAFVPGDGSGEETITGLDHWSDRAGCVWYNALFFTDWMPLPHPPALRARQATTASASPNSTTASTA